MTAQAIDDALIGTFPASDPPAWTPGIARSAPTAFVRPADNSLAQPDGNSGRGHVIDGSRPPNNERTLLKALVSLLGAVGLALLVPFAILAIITPVALVLRGAVEVAARLLAFVG